MKTQISLLALTLSLSTLTGLAQEAPPRPDDRAPRAEWNEDQPEARPQRRQRQRDVDQESIRPQQRERRQAMLQDRQGPRQEGRAQRNVQGPRGPRPGFDNQDERPGRGFQNRQQNREQAITCPNCGHGFNPRMDAPRGPRGQNMERPDRNPSRDSRAWNAPQSRGQGPRADRPRGPRWNNENNQPDNNAPMGRGPRPGFGPPQDR